MKKVILMLAMMSTLSFAFAQEKALVNVNGEHIIKVQPDEAEVNFMISTKHKDLQEAKKINDAIVSKAISYLKKQGVPEKDILTTRVNLNPYNEYVKDDKPIPMFNAQQAITFKLKDLDKLAGLLSGLVDQGVNNIQNVEFKSSKIGEIQNEARAKAMLDAKEKATILAQALGQTVGTAYSIQDNTSNNNGSPRPMMAMYKSAEMADSSQAPIATGEIEVRANVSVGLLLK